ncbi:MAG: hypothetical protein JRE57_11325 [Deltaproteobacteria bacterium]|nr:hypothetical protein [Deltaproteobacteria bacterium]
MTRTKKQSAEAAVREIRRKTRRKFAPEEKVRIVLEGLRASKASPSCAAAKALPPIDGTHILHYLNPAKPRGGGLELQAPRSKDAAFPSLWPRFIYQTKRVLPSTLYASQVDSDR